MVGDRRSESLARRVLWLDRYRRVSALALTALLLPVLIHAMASWLPAGWPSAHLYATSIALAVCTWYGIEVCLVSVLAWWETELAARERRGGLPRAQLLRRK